MAKVSMLSMLLGTGMAFSAFAADGIDPNDLVISCEGPKLSVKNAKGLEVAQEFHESAISGYNSELSCGKKATALSAQLASARNQNKLVKLTYTKDNKWVWIDSVDQKESDPRIATLRQSNFELSAKIDTLNRELLDCRKRIPTVKESTSH